MPRGLTSKAFISMFEQVGAGGTLPELDALVQRINVGSEAQCRCTVALEGPDPFESLDASYGVFPKVEAVLRAELVAVSYPGAVAPAAARIRVFDPPLAAQRHAFISGKKLKVCSTSPIRCATKGGHRLWTSAVAKAGYWSTS